MGRGGCMSAWEFPKLVLQGEGCGGPEVDAGSLGLPPRPSGSALPFTPSQREGREELSSGLRRPD